MTDFPHEARRALARAGAGKALTGEEAAALLGARGGALEELLRIAGAPAGSRSRQDGDVLAQGLRAPHDALPRPLPLLHVRQAAGPP